VVRRFLKLICSATGIDICNAYYEVSQFERVGRCTNITKMVAQIMLNRGMTQIIFGLASRWVGGVLNSKVQFDLDVHTYVDLL
jgi:hypothetical protein